MSTRLGPVIAESKHFRAELIESFSRVDIRSKKRITMDTSQASIHYGTEVKISVHSNQKDFDEITKLLNYVLKKAKF